MIAKYYKKINEKKIKCNLCPKSCIISKDQTGFCGIRKNKENKLIPLGYNKISSISIDPIEKKPLFHFYPNTNTLSIGGYGCNLDCDFCQNWQIARSNVKNDYIMKSDKIIKKAITNNIEIISYTYNEPLINYEFIFETMKKSKKNNLKNVIVSNGYINKEPLSKISKYIDGANIDIKGNKDFYKKYTKSTLEPVLNSIKLLKKEGVWLEITFLLIEGLNDQKEFLKELKEFIISIDKNIPLHINRYFPQYKFKKSKTSEKRMKEVKKYFDKDLNYVYLGNINLKGYQDTSCPICEKVLIERDNYKTKINKLNCHSKIKGEF